jgi:hypothetical protein
VRRGEQVDAPAVGTDGAAQGCAFHRGRRPHRAGRRVCVLAGGVGGIRTGGGATRRSPRRRASPVAAGP